MSFSSLVTRPLPSLGKGACSVRVPTRTTEKYWQGQACHQGCLPGARFPWEEGVSLALALNRARNFVSSERQFLNFSTFPSEGREKEQAFRFTHLGQTTCLPILSVQDTSTPVTPALRPGSGTQSEQERLGSCWRQHSPEEQSVAAFACSHREHAQLSRKEAKHTLYRPTP